MEERGSERPRQSGGLSRWRKGVVLPWEEVQKGQESLEHVLELPVCAQGRGHRD